MNLPNFEDFSATISKEVCNRIAESINEAKIQVKGSNDEERTKSLVNATISANMISTMELLHRYHDWLSEHLQK